MAEPARRAPALPDSELWSDDLYRYGCGLRRVRLPDGRVEVREVPLTPEDFLDPQVGDHLTQNSFHIEFVHTLLDMVRRRYESHPDVFVSSDLKILWGIPGLPNPSPDLVVIPGVEDRAAFRRSFSVRKERARPCLVVEVVSDDPVIRSKDHNEKVAIYERAEVQEYLIIDPPFATRTRRFRLLGYRLDATGRYQEVEPDAEGAILSETTGLWFRVSPDGQKLILVDAETGERLETSREIEARAGQETAARQEAEARAAYEAEARKEAEAKAAREIEARRQAEARAREEIARLREELDRLKGSGL